MEILKKQQTQTFSTLNICGTHEEIEKIYSLIQASDSKLNNKDMDILFEVKKSIHKLNAKGYKSENLTINMSKAVLNYIKFQLEKNEFSATRFVSSGGKCEPKAMIYGIEVNDKHPYNEIVIYDANRTFKNDLIEVIIIPD